MSIKASRFYGIGLAALTIGAFAACSSDDSNPPGNTAGTSSVGGTGGSATAGTSTGGTSAAGTGTGGTSTAGTGTGGTSAAGASGGGGAGGGGAFACKGTKPTTALIADFETTAPNAATPGQFGWTTGVPGGTFTYQAPIKADVAGKAFNAKGNVSDYFGFGIYFNDCLDAAGAGATGVSFKIKGNPGATGMITFKVQTNANHAPANMKGTCDPMGLPANNAYMYCHDAEFDIPVGATDAEVSVSFAQLTATTTVPGLPKSMIDGKDVIGLEWAFKWMDMGTAYDADVTVDDVKWTGTITGGGGGGAGGGGGGGAGGGGAGGGGAGGGGAGGGGNGGTGGTP